MATQLSGPVTGPGDVRTTAPERTGAPPRPEPAVRVRGLRKAFADDTAVLDGLDLDIRPGEFVALLGASGCGKSTLLRILAGLDREVSGEVVVPRRRAVAFQEPRLLPWKRVWRNVALGLPGDDPKGRSLAALSEVGLGHRVDAWPLTLSGGEAQRAAFARALVREPALLLLDEPFAALDALTRLTMRTLVSDLWERHRPAVLLVTHDVDEALSLADRALVLAGGGIAADIALGTGTAPGSRTSGGDTRPRPPADPRLDGTRRQLLSLLGVHT